MVLAESSSESFSSIGAAIGFAFRLAKGSAAASRGSLEAGETLLGIGRAGSGGGPFDGTGKVVGGDGTTGARSTGRGGVSVVSIGTES